MQRTYYEILGVPTDASADDIRRQFRELARKYHPDVQPDKERAHQAFVRISEAYHVLVDPTRRADYDLKLRDQARRSQPPPGAARPAGGPAPGASRPGSAPGPGSTRPGTPYGAGPAARGPRPGPGQRMGSAGPRGRSPGGGFPGAGGPRPRGPGAANIPLLLRQAHSTYARGRFRDAIQLCQTILNADRRNAPAYLILGDIYRIQGRVEQAIEMYSMAIQINPQDATAEAKLHRLLVQERSAAQRSPAAPPAAAAVTLDIHRRRLIQRMLIGTLGFSLTLFFLLILTNVANEPMGLIAPIAQWSAAMLWVMVLDGAIIGCVLSLTGAVRRMDEELIFPSLTRQRGASVPIGLLLFVTSAICFYVAGFIYIVFALMQDSFSSSVLKLFFATLGLVFLVALLVPPAAKGQILLLGGNVIFLSMLVGWLFGDLFRPQWS